MKGGRQDDLRRQGGNLTIVLTLKGRVPYTRRWMEYANACAFPFKVLVADGGLDDGTQELLSDRSAFPNVDYEYLRCPPDRSYSDYYAKLVHAVEMVHTPFVVLADNDDFFVAMGLLRAINFLSENPAYATCGGQGATFWVNSFDPAGAKGPLYGGRVEWKCTREDDLLGADKAADRMRAMSRSQADTFYYDVRRTQLLLADLRIVRDLDLKDIFLVESLILQLAMIGGKAKRLDCLYLARQRNSPGSAGVAHQQNHGDWLGRMLVPTWSDDFRKFLDALTGSLAVADEVTAGQARDVVLATYRRWVTTPLLSDLLSDASVSMPGVTQAARKLVQMPEGSLLRRIARALYRRLPWVSVDIVFGVELFARPVANARRDFKPIRDFLERDS